MSVEVIICRYGYVGENMDRRERQYGLEGMRIIGKRQAVRASTRIGYAAKASKRVWWRTGVGRGIGGYAYLQ